MMLLALQTAFNHPRVVVASRRDKVASLLVGISGLDVPKCIRFISKKSQDFQKAFAEAGMSYPVIVRLATSQTGRGLIRIDNPFDWVRVLESKWHNTPHYITQYVEYRNLSSGSYEKVRVFVIGNEISLRAYSKSSSWLVKGLQQELSEAEAIEIFQHHLGFSERGCKWEGLRKVSKSIKSRLPSDFFGDNIGVKGDGTFVLFEAYAAMNILGNLAPTGPANCINRVITNLEPTVLRCQSNPDTWYHDVQNLPPVRDALTSPYIGWDVHSTIKMYAYLPASEWPY